MSNDNYISSYSGSQVDGVIGLFHGKGLNQVTGLVQRNADGTFSVGSGGGGGSDVFYAWTRNDGIHTVTTLSELQQAKADSKIIVLNGNKIPSYQYIASSYAFFSCYIDDDEAPIYYIYKCDSNNIWSNSFTSIQPQLISGTNIKTINNQSLLGSGNITTVFNATPNGTTYNQLKTAIDDGKIIRISNSDVCATASYDNDYIYLRRIQPSYQSDKINLLIQKVAATDNSWTYQEDKAISVPDVFVVTPNVTTYNELLAAIQAGKYLCIHGYDNSENYLYWISFVEIGADAIVIDFATEGNKIEYIISDSNIWTEQYNYDFLTENSILSASKLSGSIPSSVTATTQSSGDNSTKIATTAYVDGAIANLPEPMVFEGSLGTGGTITTLPAAASTNKGFTYKVITDGTYASQAAKVGDTFISDGTAWVLIPSGDEPSGTVTSIATGSGLSGGPITSSGTISLATAFGDTVNPYGSKTANYVLAAPNGEAGVPTFRALVAADLPNGNWLNGSATGSVRTNGSYGDYTGYTIGTYAVAEGYLTAASGSCSHAEGYSTTASGSSSHAEGKVTEAYGQTSHAGGLGTKAKCKSQIAIGEYNIADTTGSTTTRGDYALIIGNGTATNARSNALTVGWNGTIYSYNSDYERDTGGSTNGGIAFTDKNGSTIAYMKAYTESDSQGGYSEGFNVGTSRTVDNSTQWNTLRLLIDSQGNSTVTVGQPAAWRKALGTPKYVVQSFYKDNMSIAAGGFNSGQTISVAKNGYTPKSIIHHTLVNATSSGKNVSICFTYSISLSGTTVAFGIRNTGTADAKIRQNVTVLYEENL